MSIVRSCVRSVVRSPVRGVFGGDDVFGPASLFSSGAQGAWYDPSDYSTLYQDAAGTTPVTAVEQPVRLMLDRSRGLVLGGELVTNGAGDSTTGWSTSGSVGSFTSTGGKLRLTSNGAVAYATQALTTVVGRLYIVNCEFVDVVIPTGVFRGIRKADDAAASVNVVNFANSSSSSLTSGSGAFNFVATATTSYVILQVNGNATSVDFDNISVRELPGNHALAPNDASRPVLRSRYNLLERSEEFDNAYWSKTRTSISANVGVAPDGTTTADKLIENTDTNTHTLFPNSALTLATTTSYTYSIYAKAAERTIIHLANNDLVGAFFNLSDGTVSDIAAGFTASITAAGSGWYRCVLTQALNSNASGRLVVRLVSTGTTTSYTGDGTSGILIWGAQLLTAVDQTATGGAYQRIAAATDYDVSNPVWRPYLAFDGSDDSFSTSAIDFSGTDEMTVFAGVTKLSDAARGMLVELSASYGNPGTFGVEVPTTPATADYGFISGGSVPAGGYAVASGFAAPITNVLTAIGDISADVTSLRLNGVVAATNTGDQGTGNYSNAALFIGRRNNTSLPLNGRLYGLTVLGRTATVPELSAMEAWVNGKTGGY